MQNNPMIKAFIQNTINRNPQAKQLYDSLKGKSDAELKQYAMNVAQSKGAKWSVEDIKSVSGIDFDTKDYYEMDFAYVMNMLWSDYCNVFTETNYYIKMAQNYLEDPDYMGDASERAYKNAKKRIKYFTEKE